LGAELLCTEVSWLTPKETRAWLEPAIEKTRAQLDQEGSPVREVDFIKALLGLELAWSWQGNNPAAAGAFDELISRAKKAGEQRLVAYGTAVRYVSSFFNMDPEAIKEIEEAIAISREGGFELETALTSLVYALTLKASGKAEQAEPRFHDAIEILQRIDNPRYNAAVYGIYGFVAEMEGDFDRAIKYYSIAVENNTAINNRIGLLSTSSALAHIARRQGDLEMAKVQYRQTIIGWREIGQVAAVAHQLECFAYIATARAEFEQAARLLGAARESRRSAKALIFDPRESEELKEALEQLAEELGEEQRDQLLTEGSLMSMDDAVQFALAKAAN